jgi:hypothetical protein
VTIDARVPDADPENDARAGMYNKSIRFSPFLLASATVFASTDRAIHPRPYRKLLRLRVAISPCSGAIAHLALPVGALLENRSTCAAEIGHVLPQTTFNFCSIRNVAAADFEGIGAQAAFAPESLGCPEQKQLSCKKMLPRLRPNEIWSSKSYRIHSSG